MGEIVPSGPHDAQAIILVDPSGYWVMPDGSQGPFVCQPNSALRVIFTNTSGNYPFGS